MADLLQQEESKFLRSSLTFLFFPSFFFVWGGGVSQPVSPVSVLICFCYLAVIFVNIVDLFTYV